MNAPIFLISFFFEVLALILVTLELCGVFFTSAPVICWVLFEFYCKSSTSLGSVRSLIPSYTWLNRSRVNDPILSDKSFLFTVKI